jgi:PAS domain S-box-containing protein
MNSASLQSCIAKIGHLLSEVSEVLNDSMPENSPHRNKLPGNNPLIKGEDPLLALEEVTNELNSIRDRIDRYHKLSLLRIEMWKAAAEDQVSEEKLIEKLLYLVGPALNLSRCSYFVILPDKFEAHCTIQWCKNPAYAALSSILPNDVVSEFIGKEHVAIYEDVPTGKKQTEVTDLLRLYNVKSFLAVPYDGPWSARGILTFSDCDAVRKWTKTETDLLIEIAHIVSAKTAQIKAEQAVIEAKKRLEHQVKARTAELAAVNQHLRNDIEERAKMQKTLAAEKEFLAITLRNIQEAVITVDAEGSIVLFNKTAELLTGWSPEEIVGKKIDTAVQVFNEKSHAERYPDFIKQCLVESGHKAEKRGMLRSRSGKELIVAYQGAPITVEKEYRGAVVVIRDITHSYFQEEELLKIRKLESVGVLAGGLAHDFNNLLTGITTNLFMARMSVAVNKEASSLINEAEKAAFKATALTKQLLSFAKGSPSIKEAASIKQLILDTVGFCLSGSNVDYRLDVPDDLFPVEVDKGQINQVINNLVLNAAQAMSEGGTITIKGENCLLDTAASPKMVSLSPGRYVKISVRDEGVGIPDEHLERIFDPYFTTKESGTGLGLTTAYSIVNKHNGHLYAESTKGKGSVFTFYLPVSDKPVNKKTAENSILNKGCGKILIMDDDVIVRTVVETLLKKAGYSPIGVSNGTQTLEIYSEALSQKDPFLVIIMDLTIPGGMGGKETVKKLREIDPTAKVIAFSGYSNDPIFTDFKEFGFDGVLSKPFSIEEFMQTIESVLSVSPADKKK